MEVRILSWALMAGTHGGVRLMATGRTGTAHPANGGVVRAGDLSTECARGAGRWPRILAAAAAGALLSWFHPAAGQPPEQGPPTTQTPASPQDPAQPTPEAATAEEPPEVIVFLKDGQVIT